MHEIHRHILIIFKVCTSTVQMILRIEGAFYLCILDESGDVVLRVDYRS